MFRLAESTRMMMLREKPELERIDSMSVKGRREEVVIWAPATANGGKALDLTA